MFFGEWLRQRRGTIIVLTLVGIFAAWGVVSINNAIAASPGRMVWDYTPPAPNVDRYAEGEFLPIAQSGNLTLLYNDANGAIQILDHTNGHIWHSIANRDIYDLDRLNPLWMAFLQSPLVINFNNKQNRDTPAIRLFSNRDIDYMQTEFIYGGVAVTYGFTSHGIFVTVEYTLEDGIFVVRVPWAGIREESNFAVIALEILPFFGAAGNSVCGYMLYPCGSGGITRFDMYDTRSSIVASGSWYTYSHRIVDLDNLMDVTEYLRHTASMPVFGIRYNDNAFLAAITQGEENTGIMAFPSGQVVDLNRIFFELYTRNIFNVELGNITVGGLGSLGQTVRRIDRDIIQMDREIKFFFLSGEDANYSGMARVYRDYLIRTGRLTNSITPGGGMPIAIQFLMGAVEPQMLLDSYIAMTTFGQVADILESLRINGVQDVYAVLASWTRGGYAPPRYWPPARQLGGRDGLRQLDSYLDAHPRFNVFLENNFISADRRVGGFSTRSDVVYNGTNVVITQGPWYLLNPAASLQRQRSFMDRMNAFGNISVAYRHEGRFVFNDYNTRAPFSKAETVDVWRTMFYESAQQMDMVAARGANQYTFAHVDFLYEVPMRPFGLSVTDYAVPFVQMVLSGMIPVAGEAGNLSYSFERQMLRWIEFGTVPIFWLTYESSLVLRNTRYNWLFTSSFDAWEERIMYVHRHFAENLYDIFGRQMVSHQVLARDVKRVEYDNGVAIYINYTSETVVVSGVTIPPVGYTVVRRDVR